jgi:hypothetical protein
VPDNTAARREAWRAAIITWDAAVAKSANTLRPIPANRR